MVTSELCVLGLWVAFQVAYLIEILFGHGWWGDRNFSNPV